MKTSDLRNEVHGYVEQADEKVLEAILTLVKPTVKQYELSEAQWAELRDRERDDREGGSASYTLEEVRERLKSKRK